MKELHQRRASEPCIVAVLRSANYFSDNLVQGIPIYKTDAGRVDLVLEGLVAVSAASPLSQTLLHPVVDTPKAPL